MVSTQWKAGHKILVHFLRPAKLAQHKEAFLCLERWRNVVSVINSNSSSWSIEFTEIIKYSYLKKDKVSNSAVQLGTIYAADGDQVVWLQEFCVLGGEKGQQSVCFCMWSPVVCKVWESVDE